MARYYIIYFKTDKRSLDRVVYAVDPDLEKIKTTYNDTIRNWRGHNSAYLILEETITNNETGEVVSESVIAEGYVCSGKYSA
jgi:hypothetical protein